MLTDTQKQQFDDAGYVVVEGVVQGDLLTQLQDAVRLIGEAEPNRRGWNERSCFRRAPFRRFLDAERLVQVAHDLIGDDVQLLRLDLLKMGAGDGMSNWHRDAGFVCGKTLSVTGAVYLQDTSLDVGPLRVVPRSHRREYAPTQTGAKVLDGEVSLPVPAGAAIFHDSCLWHTASANRSTVDCWGVFPIFGRYWIKRLDSQFTQPLPADLLLTKDPVKRQLLGLELKSGTPTYFHDDDEYYQCGDAGIDFPLKES